MSYTSDNPFHGEPHCSNCGYKLTNCACQPTEVKPSLITLIPEIAPLSEDESHNFDEVPAYDNLDPEDMHFVQTAIRRFNEGKDIDMQALNTHLQIRSLERRTSKLQEDIDNAV